MADTLFQRIAGAAGANSSVTVLSTSSVGTLTTTQIGTYATCEIAVIGSNAAAVHFTDANATTGIAAVVPSGGTVGDRVIPGNTVVYEYLPQGAAFVSAIALATPGPTVVFTPGKAINPD